MRHKMSRQFATIYDILCPVPLRSHLGTLALKTQDFSKKSVVLVKRKNGFTKTIPWTENPGRIRRRPFSKSIFAFY